MKEVCRKRSASASSSPCAACKLLRRKCSEDCVFAPYFPADELHKFANVHKVFGASNVNKLLKDLPLNKRGDAVSSIVYEANARVRDPVYGCVGTISHLQQQIDVLRAQLALARAEVVLVSTPCNDNGYGSSNNYFPCLKPLHEMDMVEQQAVLTDPVWPLYEI